MNRHQAFERPAHIDAILVTDIDHTLLDPSRPRRAHALFELKRRHPEMALVYVTGRQLTTTLPLFDEDLLPTPDLLISDFGATIWTNTAWPDAHHPLRPALSTFPLSDVKRTGAAIAGLVDQHVQTPFRCAFNIGPGVARSRLADGFRALRVDVLISFDFLDILPEGVNKRTVVDALLKPLAVGKDVILAGDSENDTHLLSSFGSRGVHRVLARDATPGAIHMCHGVPFERAESPGPEGIVHAVERIIRRRESSRRNYPAPDAS